MALLRSQLAEPGILRGKPLHLGGPEPGAPKVTVVCSVGHSG